MLQTAIAAAMIRRNLYWRWPGFFAYTIFHILQPGVDLIGVVQKWNPLTYYYFFYGLEALSLVLSMVVVYEVFVSVLEPYNALRMIGKRLFLGTATVLVVVGLLFVSWGPANSGAQIFKVVFYSERTLRIVQVGVLVLLFALSRSLALSWRSEAFGIALGYGIYASIQLVVVILRLKYVNFGYQLISWVSTLSFILMCVIWLWYAVQGDKVVQQARVVPHNDIERWNRALEGVLARKKL
ncbi:MAG TPA: hypothetical protein VKW78_17775 [Terriglobales bacterium]|nr:hypothetical protein [Terriglobales bacterium]